MAEEGGSGEARWAFKGKTKPAGVAGFVARKRGGGWIRSWNSSREEKLSGRNGRGWHPV